MQERLVPLERLLMRHTVQLALFALLALTAAGLAGRLNQEHGRRVDLVVSRFSDKAAQSAGLLDDVVASAGTTPRHVKITPAVEAFLSHFLGGLSPTPGFEAAAFSDGKLLAGSVPHVLRTLRDPGRQVDAATVHTLGWRLVISLPRAELLKSVGSDTFGWLMLGVFALSTMLGVLTLRALGIRTQELEATTAELKRTNTDLQAFASAAAHDIRGPLRRIAGFIDLVVRDETGKLSERSGDYLARIRRQALRLDGVVEDLVTYARAGEGVVMEYVPLQKVVDDARALLSEEVLASRGVVEVKGTLPEVRGNEAALQQAVRNLLSNGLKFHEPAKPPHVEISVVQTPAANVIRVRDWGIGIEPKFREKVFQPFNRLHAYDEYEGTGLGLATVARVIEQLGGSVRAVDPPAGEGIQIELTLPKGTHDAV